MSGIRTIILVGLVAADPDSTKSIRNRTKVTFMVGVTREYPYGGVTRMVTGFHRVVSWGHLAEFCATLNKGQGVYVEGTLVNRAYEEDGERKYTTEIHANDVANVSWRKVRGVETISFGSAQDD